MRQRRQKGTCLPFSCCTWAAKIQKKMIFADRREHVCYQVEVLTLATIVRAFKVRGISASLATQGIGRVRLW